MSTEQNPKPVIDPGSNVEPLMKDITKAYADITGLKKKRGENNAKITAILTTLEAKGVSKRAMRMAMTYYEMSEDEREGFDNAYEIVRAALDVPVQGSLFGAA